MNRYLTLFLGLSLTVGISLQCMHSSTNTVKDPLSFLMPKEELQENITNALANAFGADHLYQDPLDPTNLNQWQQIVDGIQTFIIRYTLNNTKVLDIYRDIKRTNHELIKTINLIHHTLRTLRNSKNRANNPDIIHAKKLLITLEASMREVHEHLKAFEIDPKDSGLLKSRDVLAILALSVELTAHKAEKDLQKELSN